MWPVYSFEFETPVLEDVFFTCDGMHGKSDVLSLLSENVDHLGNGVLTSARGQTEAGHDDDVLGIGQSLKGIPTRQF
jgi:hypothetical protein